jgi:FkbM family methyltransferase
MRYGGEIPRLAERSGVRPNGICLQNCCLANIIILPCSQKLPELNAVREHHQFIHRNLFEGTSLGPQMNKFEKVSSWTRHLPLLEHANWLWDPVRPMYDRAISHFGRNGLERTINGSDRILVSTRARETPEIYEPEVWRALMAELRPGDTFVDVGAFIGLYAIAIALRLNSSGRVIAFEPDHRNYLLLQEHVRLNRVKEHVELHDTAVSDKEGQCHFLADGSSQARFVQSSREHAAVIKAVTLDSAFAAKRIDLLKIDVEGHEEMVLRGAQKLLHTPSLKPRSIFIEVHPYAWTSSRAGSDALLGLLHEAGYRVETVEGIPVSSIESYGEIIARI